MTKSLEILYVVQNAKPCARIMVYEDELDKVRDFLTKNKLNYIISNFKVIKQTLQSDFYSDKSIKIQKNAPEKGHFLVYISKNMEVAEKAKLAEEKNQHYGLGLILGYPACCCEFFEKNFDDNDSDLTLKTLRNSKGYVFPFCTNIAARHFDVALLSHFPHSFDCKESIEIAKKNLDIINKHSNKLAVMFSEIFKGVVIYTIDEGIFLLRRYEKINDEVIYSNILSTTKSKLYFLLNSNNKLKIIDKNNFIVNDVNIHGEKFGAMVFV